MPKVLPVRLGIVLAILEVVSVLTLKFASNKFNYGGAAFKIITSVIPGCKTNDFSMNLLCVLLAAADGFLAGVLIAVLYNNITVNI